MRLTLRTMLAYLDELLEPDDAEDIGKKIEASEFATGLMHRTRDCMRKLRLGVPEVIGRGLAADPNTVAEYLDNELSHDRVAEFENICLESEKHLAEVAACHQVLTLVLHQPAEVDDRVRQRMYQVISPEVAAPPIQIEAVRVVSATPPPVAPALPKRARPEVPEYLRESRSRLWPVAALIFIAAFATFGGLLLFGPLRDRMTALVQGTTDEAEPTDVKSGEGSQATSDDKTVEDQGNAADKDKTPAAGGNPTDKADGPTDKADGPTDKADGAAADEAAGPAEQTDVDKPVQPLVPDTDATDDPAAPVAPEPGATPTEPIERPVPDGPSSTGNPLRPGKPGPPAGKTPPDDDSVPAPIGDKPAGPDEDMPERDAGAKDGVKPGAEDGAKPGAEQPTEAVAEPASFGRYTSKHDVLLKYDAENNLWNRLPAMASLAKGDRLMSLPSFRPTIALSSNLSLQPDGAAMFELVGWTNQGVPIISVEFGRFLLLTVGKAGNPLQLKLDDHVVQLTFVQPESTAALEVRRLLRPGADPEGSASPLTVDLYVTSGQLRVAEEDAPVELEGPLHRALLTKAGNAPGDNEFPKWLTSDSLTSIDRDGQAMLESTLVPDRPVALVELCSHRKREIRSLAIRSIAYIGRFEPCLEALGDKDEKTAWPLYIDELRTALARDPNTAAQIRKTLEKQRAGDAAALYRMLWGYGADDLKNGAAGDLVEALNHDALDVRVLAFHNLQAATGLPPLGYHPGDPAVKRNGPAKVWKERLRTGKLLPKASSGPTKSRPSAKSGDTKSRDKASAK